MARRNPSQLLLIMNSNLSSACRRLCAGLLLIGPTGVVQATLPEPDHVIYGTISIGTNQVTAAQTNVIVELRRSPSGPALASYSMGANPAFGDFYSVNAALEWLDPASLVNPGFMDPNASAPGTGLYLVVREGNLTHYQTNFGAGPPAGFLRLDFGPAPAPPASLVDQWQQAHFGGTGLNLNSDPTGKGQTLLADYVAGTDPNDTNAVFKLVITQTGGTEVSFFGRRAEGAGYNGLTRIYSLDRTTNLVVGPWLGVPSYTNLVGSNLTILYVAPTGAAASQFYRARVRLQ